MSNALLPCPFCGSKDIGKDGEPGLVCYDCGGAANNAESWNRRAQSDAPAPLPADAPFVENPPNELARAVANNRRALGLPPQADAAPLVGRIITLLHADRETTHWSDWIETAHDLLREAAAALAQRDVPRAEPMEWIRIKDRLPPIVYEPDGGVNCVLVRHAPEWTPDGGSEYQVSNSVWANRNPHQYTHWAQIPSPDAAKPERSAAQRDDDARGKR